ncbi:dienelactone hydrolase family protein [Microbispora sp. RL4-1S]|uniref:Dienelactone hydrolase family protein n=1 Tax=Microbispora oryzae TaxID=2806554 RepID=A0A940WK89_9ACTN|nr:dienelactone hydrolase family protein [Microbispora oryzae]MBP2706508.1 dienelactone hydrolase family protein [Microbispora oryzae]
MTERTHSVNVPDGEFDLHLWLPERGYGPGLVVIQEIFGVGEYIRTVSRDLAALGYVVGAPDLFWRSGRNWTAGRGDEGLAQGLERGARFDVERGVADCLAALEALGALPEVRGGTGVVGFCLGGSLAYLMAARTDLGAVVSFYGSAVPETLDLVERVHSPIQFHFGGQDSFITRDKVAAVEEAVAGRPGMEIHVQETAGHAFHNFTSARFHDPEAAPVAWALTTGFLARHLPAGD